MGHGPFKEAITNFIFLTSQLININHLNVKEICETFLVWTLGSDIRLTTHH